MSTPITSRNYKDKLCVLVRRDGSLVNIGEEAVDFRGDAGTVFTGGRAPHKESSQGKVWVRPRNCDHFGEQEYYPSVFHVMWREVFPNEDVGPR